MGASDIHSGDEPRVRRCTRAMLAARSPLAGDGASHLTCRDSSVEATRLQLRRTGKCRLALATAILVARRAGVDVAAPRRGEPAKPEHVSIVFWGLVTT
jgi:hypothetical protein